MISPALEVDDLATWFTTRTGIVKAVDGVSFQVGRGEVVALVGESGSGKTVTGLSILGLIEPPGRVMRGRIRVAGETISGLRGADLRRVRGRRVAMIFQDPMLTLNPVLRLETQMIEAIAAHDRTISRAWARARCAAMLAAVGIPEAETRLRGYPHELSGGMRQRVGIAIALLNSPDVIIADEATTALDVTTQAQVIHEIRALCQHAGTALVWITHDLAVVASLARTICVMYAGRVVERGPVDDVIDRPLHPYTRGLLDSVPDFSARKRRLNQIAGAAPDLAHLPPGCAFRTRCPRAATECESEPAPVDVGAGRMVRCWRPLP